MTTGLRRLAHAMCRFAALALCAASAPAATPIPAALDLPQYHHTAWTAQQGAPADIWALAQGRDGYLWLGTGMGLYRFDGTRFEQYPPPHGQEFPSSNITALYAAPDGALWIGFLLGGASVLRDGRFTHYPVEQDAPAGLVLDFVQDSTGAVWSVSKAGLGRFDGHGWRRVGADWSFPGGTATALMIDRQARLWVAAEHGLFYLPPGEREFRSSGEDVESYAALAQAQDGTVWLSDAAHGTRALPGIGGPDYRPRALPRSALAHFANMAFDPLGTLWGSDRSGGGVLHVAGSDRFASGRSLTVDDLSGVMRKQDGLSSDKTVPVLVDREGSVWVGTNLGLHRFRPNSVVMLTDARLTQQRSYSLAATDLGVLVTNDDRVYRLDRDGPVAIADTVKDPVGGMIASDAGAWLTAHGSLWHLDRAGLHRIAPPASGYPAVSLIARDDSGGLLALWQPGGLQRFDGTGWEALSYEPPRADGVMAMTAAPGGEIWIGYTDNTLVRWSRAGQRLFGPADGLRYGAVTALAATSRGLLVAAETGLMAFREERLRPLRCAQDGFLHGISGIVEDRAGDLWLNGFHGIVRVPAQAWHASVDSGSDMACRLFDFEDGLSGVAQQAPYSSSAISDDEGRLWFATNQGLASIDPARLRRIAVVPPVFITDVAAQERRYPAGAPIRLPKGTRELRIDYTALSLAMPGRVRFRYRLSGVDRQWQEAGERRQAFYTNLRSGDYHFQVIASNNDGVWNLEGDALTLSIAPRFIETWWFAASCMLVVLAMLSALYLLRLRQIAARVRTRLEERYHERERIARELHDTLLQSVQGLVLRFQAIANRLPQQEPTRQAIEQALDRADEVLCEARDRVWDLRAGASDPARDLAQAFARVGEDLAQQHPAEYKVLVEGRLPELEPLLRDEIYQIGREALINAFRHAHATRVEVEIACQPDALRFRFRDDGAGIGDEVMLAGGRQRHWGLSGMRERAEGIGAELNLWTGHGGGTEIELVLPCRKSHREGRGQRRHALDIAKGSQDP